MQDEKNVIETEQNVDDFIDQVKELKENTVSKEEYQKVVEEKKKLMSALINGDVSDIDIPNSDTTNEELIERIKSNRNKLTSGEELNNLEFCKTAVQLRKDVIEAYGPEQDPFLPHGHDYVFDEKDAERAQAVSDTFEHCIEYAEGDSEVFTNELMRLTKDTGPKKFKR